MFFADGACGIDRRARSRDDDDHVVEASYNVDGLGIVTISAAASQVSLQPMLAEMLRLAVANAAAEQRVGDMELALDLNDAGVLMLGRLGEVVFANQAARALLEDQDGVRRQRAGVAATDLSDAIKFRTAVDHVGSSENAATTVLSLKRRKTAKPLFAAISPGGEGDVSAIVHLFDPDRDLSRMLKPVCDLHRLSAAEARLACALAEGLSILEAAAKVGIKEMTARGYLKQIFLKTGAGRQAELAHLMLASAVRIAEQTVRVADYPHLRGVEPFVWRSSDAVSRGRTGAVNN